MDGTKALNRGVLLTKKAALFLSISLISYMWTLFRFRNAAHSSVVVAGLLLILISVLTKKRGTSLLIGTLLIAFFYLSFVSSLMRVFPEPLIEDFNFRQFFRYIPDDYVTIFPVMIIFTFMIMHKKRPGKLFTLVFMIALGIFAISVFFVYVPLVVAYPGATRLQNLLFVIFSLSLAVSIYLTYKWLLHAPPFTESLNGRWIRELVLAFILFFVVTYGQRNSGVVSPLTILQMVIIFLFVYVLLRFLSEKKELSSEARVCRFRRFLAGGACFVLLSVVLPFSDSYSVTERTLSGINYTYNKDGTIKHRKDGSKVLDYDYAYRERRVSGTHGSMYFLCLLPAFGAVYFLIGSLSGTVTQVSNASVIEKKLNITQTDRLRKVDPPDLETAPVKKAEVIEPTASKNEVSTAAVSVADEIKKFKELFDNGIITQEEFEAKKKQLLDL